MSAPYQVAGKQVEPVSDLLKAVIEVNWSMTEAEIKGWKVKLTINPDCGDQLAVEVSRADGWPSPDDDQEPAK